MKKLTFITLSTIIISILSGCNNQAVDIKDTQSAEIKNNAMRNEYAQPIKDSTSTKTITSPQSE